MSRSSDSVIDAVVVGGGPAGLNAALVLGRARRRTVMVDGGEPRNASSHAMHGFLSRDGFDPAELRQIGREQLQAYPSVEVIEASVDKVAQASGRFHVTTSDGTVFETRKLLLALGVRDTLPDVPGLRELYGISVFHCPYCDGWEARDEPVLSVSEGPSGYRQAMLFLSWTQDVALCTLGPSGLGVEERAQLAAHNIALYEQRIQRLETAHGRLTKVVFADGSSLARRALFFHGPAPLSSALPSQIGCKITEGGRIEIDEAGRTSVPGVFGAGDAARREGQHPATQVILAAASGALAGIALHQELVHEDVGLTPALPSAEAAAPREMEAVLTVASPSGNSGSSAHR